MIEDDVLPYVCAAALALGAIAVIAFFIYNLRAFTYQKRKEGANTCLTVTAKRNLNRVVVDAKFGEEGIKFERKRVRKGQSIDFVFPASQRKAKLTVETESGNIQAAEV